MFKNLLKNSATLLTQQQTSILSAAFVIMAMSLLGKILGLIRLRLLIHYFGDGSTTAIFVASDRLSSLLFDTLVLGILSVSFIPVYTSFFATGDKEKASRMASSLINLTIIIYIAALVIAFIFTKQLALLLGYGLVHNSPENLALMVSLLRYILFAQFFLIVGGYFTAILQSHQRFMVPAIANAVYNISVVLGLVFLAPMFNIYSAVIGMIIGGFLMFAIQIPFLRHLFDYTFLLKPKTEGLVKVVVLALPRMFGNMSSVLVENLHIALASLQGALMVISLDYATRVSIVPVSLFGMAIAQAALPSLTIAWAKNERQEYAKIAVAAINQILFLTLPIAAVFIVLRLPIVRLLFGDPNFGWLSTVTTGRMLAVLGVGVIAQAALMLLARAFYAMQDTKTPLYVGLVTLGLDATSAIILVGWLRLPAIMLAFAFSITTIINAIILLYILTKRTEILSLRSVVLTPAKLIVCTLGMMTLLYIPLQIMDAYVWEHVYRIGPFTLPDSLQIFIVDTRYTANLIILTATASVLGFFAYLGLAIVLNVEEVNIVTKALRKVTDVKRILSQAPEIIESEHQVTH